MTTWKHARSRRVLQPTVILPVDVIGRCVRGRIDLVGDAAGMLSNELKTIMQAQDSPITVDTVDDDVYHLIISLHKINPESPLSEVIEPR